MRRGEAAAIFRRQRDEAEGAEGLRDRCADDIPRRARRRLTSRSVLASPFGTAGQRLGRRNPPSRKGCPRARDKGSIRVAPAPLTSERLPFRGTNRFPRSPASSNDAGEGGQVV